MTIQITSVITRPDTNTSWKPPGIVGWYLSNQHFLDTWYEKGRLLSNTWTEGELSATSVRTFIDQQAFIDFVSDPLLQEIRNQRDAYHTLHDLVTISTDIIEI
jgi:hypothetical protein